MAISINLLMDAGASFEAIMTIENEDHTIFNLTNLIPYCQMRKSYYTKSAITITAAVEGDPTKGQIKLSLLPVQSAVIKAGRYVYDVEVHNTGSTYVKRVLQGVITVCPNVTRIP